MNVGDLKSASDMDVSKESAGDGEKTSDQSHQLKGAKQADVSMIKREDRDEAMDDTQKREGGEERDDPPQATKPSSAHHHQSKPSPKSRKGKSSSGHSPHPSPQRNYMPDGYHSYHQPPSGRGPYPPHHGMHGAVRGPPHPNGPGPYSHPPPHYYGGGPGGPHDHYRGPPPPHYHQMPPLPHPGQPNHYGAPSGHYGHPPNISGRPGAPPGYHPGYGAPYPGHPPHMGYHGGPPPSSYHPSHGASDSSSISSSRSKRSSKSHTSSNGSRKKRTIDGVRHDPSNSSNNDKSLPLSYSFRRTNSSSSSSTVTASNNADHHSMGESPQKRDRASSRASNFLPPLAHSSNIFDSEQQQSHRRTNSGTSTTSSLSVGGFSLSSYEGPKADGVMDDIPMLKASPKRRKGDDSAPLAVDSASDRKSIFKRKGTRPANSSDRSIDGAETSRFEQLSMNDHDYRQKKDRVASSQNLFLSLSTSPINHPEVDETPISKNTKGQRKQSRITVMTNMDDEKTASIQKPGRGGIAETPTPPHIGDQTEMMTDEHTLNIHLRDQSFTPLPHSSESGVSPSNGAFSGIAPSLSWSIAGDTPSLEDLANCSWEENERDEKKRPESATSQMSSATRNMVISPHNFSLWKEEHESHVHKKDDEDIKDEGESIRLSMLSPNSEIAMAVDGTSGTTTPLPIFFRESGSDERENLHSERADKKPAPGKHYGSNRDVDTEHMHHSMWHRGGPKQPGPRFFPHGAHRDGLPPTPVYAGSKPPTPHYPGSNMNLGFARSPLHGDRRDFGPMFGHPPGPHNDRIRNLRGRMPPGSHMAPMPIHIPPPMSSHHPLTSPMGLPGKGQMWSPHHGGMPPQMASPHHMSPMDITQSKRKCVPLKPPIPTKFQGDMEKSKGADVPEFTSLVNFPAHMSQKQAVNLPEGMRCCVMCGQACPCSTGNKKSPTELLGGKKDGNLTTRSANGQDVLSDKNGYAIIPTQNKGLCTLCDVNVWVVVSTGLEIKWCKGCKNFRPWAAFGDKGLATKCLRCRERQREKYAVQKEEKEKARMQKAPKGTKV